MVVTQGDEREISQGLKFCGWFLQSSIQNIDKKYIQTYVITVIYGRLLP